MSELNHEGMKEFELELADILESNLANKDRHVQRLSELYGEHQAVILETYTTWKELAEVEVPVTRPQMDDAFYKMLKTHTDATSEQRIANPAPQASQQSGKVLRLFTPLRMAVAATFLIGMMAGHLLDFGSTAPQEEVPSESYQEEQVHFASLEMTPSAMKRMQGINEVKEQTNPDLKIIDALNKVILNDPNVNVRLTAIETMVLFSNIPEARAYLIEAIPHQESPIVQLELADVMTALEEQGSADKWNQLLKSDKIETETRIHLKESLRTIL